MPMHAASTRQLRASRGRPTWAVRTNNSSGLTTAFTVDVKNQLTGGPTAAYGYDNNGNLTSSSSGHVTYSYTDENELATVTYLNSYKAEFVYDGLGRLRKRIEYSCNATYGWAESGDKSSHVVTEGNAGAAQVGGKKFREINGVAAEEMNWRNDIMIRGDRRRKDSHKFRKGNRHRSNCSGLNHEK